MKKTKQEVSNLLTRLPDNCSLEDIQYHLYVLQKIEKGLDNIKDGKIYTQHQVEKKISRWIGK